MGDGAERLEGGGVLSTEDEEDRGLSRSATKEEGGPREDTVCCGLLSPSRSRSRSRSLLELRVRSSIGPAPPPWVLLLLWPLMWVDDGVLLRGLKVEATGDILTGCRP